MKYSILKIFVVLLLFNFLSATENLKFEPNWESIDSRELPKWFDEAKIGIFLHWGVYSVPSFRSEWFWWWFKGAQSPPEVDYMNKNFKPGFTYQDFARDFTAEHYDPVEWAKIFEESGAKYVVLTTKHHEGYTLWPSSYSFSWNSMDVGPHRDLVGDLAEAIRKNTNIHFGVYYSLMEWFNPLYLQDKENSYQTNTYASRKAIPELKELITKYQPEIIWSDGEWEAPDEYWNSTDFLVWLYNESPVRDIVVANDRWGSNTPCKHGGYWTCHDKYNPGVLQEHKYENAMTVDRASWGHRLDAKLSDFLSVEELISEIASTVSTNGNILINVGPDQHGLIDVIFVERLKDMGKWLKMNGDAIYATKPWIFQNDTVTPNIWYTSKELSDSSINVFAIVLKYPYENSGVALYAMDHQLNDDSKIYMLGYTNPLEYSIESDHVFIKFPPKQELDRNDINWAWTLKFEIKK